MASLFSLLLTCDGVTEQNASEVFDALALSLMHKHLLSVNGQPFRIIEIEFYFFHPLTHPDPSVHRSPAQLHTAGEWYFHREKAARIGFTLKGLDLTFGKPGVNYGGILIRAVEKANEIIEGPSKVVDEILRAFGVESVTELKQVEGWREKLCLIAGSPRVFPIHTGPRIGLMAGKPFWDAPYRYRLFPEKTKKDRKTILGGRKVHDVKHETEET